MLKYLCLLPVLRIRTFIQVNLWYHQLEDMLLTCIFKAFYDYIITEVIDGSLTKLFLFYFKNTYFLLRLILLTSKAQ